MPRPVVCRFFGGAGDGTAGQRPLFEYSTRRKRMFGGLVDLGPDELTVLHPIAGSGHSGWLKLRISLASLQEAKRHQWQDSLLTAVAVVVVSTCCCWFSCHARCEALRRPPSLRDASMSSGA